MKLDRQSSDYKVLWVAKPTSPERPYVNKELHYQMAHMIIQVTIFIC